ncbi:ATPase [Alteromonas macleodii str. 'Balearic Sea AD45']|uniref:AAA family ATPase n=1 Tax=Alteromonas macleodii TaxID=28108 RepID=UPI000286D56A|nr:AAA family ATPase [Alteromonas macleodii]AFT94983.1 ATPase [Alteromonas macleodii str. 'Balearic Sea AD45']
MSLQARIKSLVEHIASGMHEREDIISLALLGALSNQNTFLFGPPGTAKSLISRRIACAFKQPQYFEHLMNRFTTPEELFGPVSLKELKEDRYVRKTNKYLPTADFAFLDEIWKSSPAILNTLLTMINEKTFKNGDEIQNTPLKALIAASNETPLESQGLEALYDRFIVRLMVSPIELKDNFEALLNAKPTSAVVKVPSNIQVTEQEWSSWGKKIHQVTLSQETIQTIHAIRHRLAEQFDQLNVYVSDRRWQKIAQLLKASAFFNDRKETNHSDALLISNCIWTAEENRLEVAEIVYQAIKDIGVTTEVDTHSIDTEKDKLDKEIHKELFYKNDVYKTEKIGNKKFFVAKLTFSDSVSRREVQRTIYIPYSKLKTRDTFHPVDKSGNEKEEFQCTFDGHGTCNVVYKGRSYYSHRKEEKPFTPKVLFHKGDKKNDVNSRLISSLAGSVADIRKLLLEAQQTCLEKNEEYKKKLASPFVNERLLNIPLEAINDQLSGLALRIKDCERLEALCND